jgi:hypothetical protein
MLVFMAFGALAGVFFDEPHYGPRLHYRGQYTLLINEDWPFQRQADEWQWVENRTGMLETMAETIGCQEMIRKAAEHLKRPDLVVPRQAISVTVANGSIPRTVVVTVKTLDPRLRCEFMDALIQVYIDFQKTMAMQGDGMPTAKPPESIQLVEVMGDEVTQWHSPRLTGSIWGAVAGFACFVLFQWRRGDY